MPQENLTMSADFQVQARAVDFVTRFTRNWEHLQALLGIMRPIRKEPGTKLYSKYAEVSNLGVPPREGEKVNYTKAQVKQKEYAEITLERHAKAVTDQAISDWGFDVAVQKTDDAFLLELQNRVVDRWYDYLKTGTLTESVGTFQMALAKAQGKVRNKFKAMHKGITSIVGFCNIDDAYEYLGAANINNVEQEFGLNYIKNFLGYSVLFLLSDSELPKGTVIATPVENINLYYVAPSDADFQKAGLKYVTDGETNMIGISIQPKYDTGESVTYAMYGMSLFSEYLDGIAVISFGTTIVGTVTIGPDDQSHSQYGVAVSTIQGADVAVSDGKVTGTLKYMAEGNAITDVWGAGHFLALKFTGVTASGATSVKVGLDPSQSSGLVELVGEEDQTGVFKINNKDVQKFKLVATNGATSKTMLLDLSGLTLQGAGA